MKKVSVLKSRGGGGVERGSPCRKPNSPTYLKKLWILIVCKKFTKINKTKYKSTTIRCPIPNVAPPLPLQSCGLCANTVDPVLF